MMVGLHKFQILLKPRKAKLLAERNSNVNGIKDAGITLPYHLYMALLFAILEILHDLIYLLPGGI